MILIQSDKLKLYA